MMFLALLLAVSGPSAPATAADLNAQRDDVLRSYWIIRSSPSCLDPGSASRFEAANTQMQKLMVSYRESATKAGGWSPPPMFQQQTYSCSEAGARLAQFEAQIKGFERALAGPAPAAAAPDPWLSKQFLYYRAVAFRGMAAEKMCGGGPVRAEFDALSRRLEEAREKLAQQSRSARFEQKTDTLTRALKCSDAEAGFTLRGYGNAVAEVEAAAK